MLEQWPDLLLVFALAVSQAVQDYLAFSVKWETGWFSVTWRWRGEFQWYDELGGWLAGPFPEGHVKNFIADTVSTIGTNIHTMFSDAWHLMAACKSVAISALVYRHNLLHLALVAIFFALVFEYTLTLLHKTREKAGGKKKT